MLLLLFLPTSGTTTAAADLFEAIYDTCNGDATLNGLFGRSGWLWINEAPETEPFPYAVLTQPHSIINYESFDGSNSEPSTEHATYQISVFSTSRTLGKSIGVRLSSLLESTTFSYTSGTCLSFLESGQTDSLDPDRGPGGVDVWHRSVMFDSIDFSTNTITATSYTPSPTSIDVQDAIQAVLDSDGTLASAFGHTGWLWSNEAPETDGMPYAVLTQAASNIDYETSAADGLTPSIEHATYEIAIFAANRATCRTLGDRVTAILGGASVPFNDGYLMYAQVTGSTDELDLVRGTQGIDRWHRTLTISTILGH